MKHRVWRALSLAAAAAVLLLSFGACAHGQGEDASSAQAASSQPAVKTHVRLAGLKGPAGIGMAYLLQSAQENAAQNDYSWVVAADPDEIGARLVAGEYDIAALPTDLAAALYNASEGKIRLLALSALGALYVLERGESVQSLADLSGKTIWVGGQDAVPGYVLNYLLAENGVEDVAVESAANRAALAEKAAAGEADLCLLSEPDVAAVTAQNEEMRVALDLTQAWDDLMRRTEQDGVLATGCIAVRAEFAQKNPDAVRLFLQEYRKSVEQVNADAESAAQLCERFEIADSAEIAQRAIPRCGVVCLDGAQMQLRAEPFYRVLFDANAKSVGGRLPDENFYY